MKKIIGLFAILLAFALPNTVRSDIGTNDLVVPFPGDHQNVPGAGFQDTVPGQGKLIPAPWDKINLTTDRMKPGYPFQEKATGSHFPWLPVILGTAGAGGVVVLLTAKKDGGETPEPCVLVPVAEITPATCGRADGSIALSVPGETDVRYLWSTGASTGAIEGLSPGTYMVTLTRGVDECRTIKTYTVPDQMISIQATLQPTAADCGIENGSISTQVLPAGQYEFLWSNGASTKDISGLPPGNYSLSICLGSTCNTSVQTEVSENATTLVIDHSVTGGSCLGGGDIIVNLMGGSGSGQVTLVVDGPAGSIELSLLPGQHSLNQYMEIRSGQYVLTAYEKVAGQRCGVTIELSVPNTGPVIDAIDDQYQTPYETVVTGNFLNNDQGLDIRIIRVDDAVNGEVTWETTGNFAFQPDAGFSGEASFKYAIADACDSTDEATVIIEVLKKECDFTIQFSQTPASCGYTDGSVHVVVNEPGSYTFWWDNGQTGPDLTGVPAGEYMVHIRDDSLDCTLDFKVFVDERPADYVSPVQVIPPVCSTPGDIIFEVFTPSNGPLLMEVFHPGGLEQFDVPPGMVLLSEYVPIVGGAYHVVVTDESIGPGCIEDFSLIMDPLEFVEIALEGIQPPTLPTSMDGAIFGVVIDGGQEPYSIFLNGQFRGTFSGNNFTITGLPVGQYDFWITDANGCMSNVLNVFLIFVGDPGYVGVRSPLMSSTLPGTPEHPAPAQNSFLDRLELFGSQPVISKFLYADGGLLFGKESLMIRGGMTLRKNIAISPRWHLSGELGGGVVWDGSRQAEWYGKIGPSVVTRLAPQINLRLDMSLFRASESWIWRPALSVEFPID